MEAFSKDFFGLQLSFAEKICALSGMPLESVLLDYTNDSQQLTVEAPMQPFHELYLR